MDYGNGTRLYDGLAQSLDDLKSIDGRKVVVIFSDGDDTASKNGRRSNVTKRARADNVMVYAIGLASQYSRQGRRGGADSTGSGSKKARRGDGRGIFRTDALPRVVLGIHSRAEGTAQPVRRSLYAVPLDGRVHKVAVFHVTEPHLNVNARRTYLAAEMSERSHR